MRLMVLGLLFAVALPALADPLRVGIFPRRSPEQTQQLFGPLMGWLEQRLGTPVTLYTPVDFPSFWEHLTRGDYDLVHLNQYQYVRAAKELGLRVLAMNEEFGRSRIAGALWVRRGGGVYRIGDLRGRKIVFGGGPQAMVSYILPMDLLRRAGLNAGDYLAEFTLHPAKALRALYYRQGAAAGAGDIADRLPAVRASIDTGQVRILAHGLLIAHLPWAVRKGLPAAERREIREALLSLGRSREGRRVLKQAGLTGLVPAGDWDYDPVRSIVARVLGEVY